MYDNVISFIEHKIKAKKLEKYEKSEAFSEGLLLGLEAGIKYEKGQLKINKLEHKVNSNENDD